MFYEGMKPLTPRAEDSRVSTDTRRLLRKAGFHINHYTNNKYRHVRFRSKRDKKKKETIALKTSLDFACMQYMGVVRHYIQRKHNLVFRELELLLYLYPVQFWSKKDYSTFPHTFSTRTVKTLFRKGLCEPIFDNIALNSDKQCYRLSKYAKRIVAAFYDHLHLQKTIPEEAKNNPLFRVDVAPIDQMKAKAICQMNQIIRGDETKTDAHIKLDARIQKRVKGNSDEAKERFSDIFEKIKFQQRLDKKKKEIEKRKR
jgi:hypothetical protein